LQQVRNEREPDEKTQAARAARVRAGADGLKKNGREGDPGGHSGLLGRERDRRGLVAALDKKGLVLAKGG